MKVDIKNIDRKYEVVYSDPPWAQTKGNIRKCRPNQTKKLDYDTMSLDDIIEKNKSEKRAREKYFNKKVTLL